MKKYKLIKDYPLCHISLNSITEMYEDFASSWPEYFQEVKEPLFVTEDGVEVFNGDIYYVPIFSGNNKVMEYMAYEPATYSQELTRLSTKEAAEKWIYDNKPLFSRKQILDAMKDIYIHYDELDKLKKQLGI